MTIPEAMVDDRWQFRLYPDLFILEDSTRLDPVLITGELYRKAQLKGYERYNKFLSQIVQDDMEFLNQYQFELFIQRNLPELFAFKTDSTEVSEAVFKSHYGLDEQTIVEHYINKARRKANAQLKRKRGKMYDKYIPAPIVTEGIRLDSVVNNGKGDIIYHYVQTIETRPKLRKATIILSGEIYQMEKMIYSLPTMEPLVYYISSTSSFADESIVKYLGVTLLPQAGVALGMALKAEALGCGSLNRYATHIDTRAEGDLLAHSIYMWSQFRALHRDCRVYVTDLIPLLCKNLNDSDKQLTRVYTLKLS